MCGNRKINKRISSCDKFNLYASIRAIVIIVYPIKTRISCALQIPKKTTTFSLFYSLYLFTYLATIYRYIYIHSYYNNLHYSLCGVLRISFCAMRIFPYFQLYYIDMYQRSVSVCNCTIYYFVATWCTTLLQCTCTSFIIIIIGHQRQYATEISLR